MGTEKNIVRNMLVSKKISNFAYSLKLPCLPMKMRLTLAFLLVLLLSGCRRESVAPTGNAMYYWRSVFRLDSAERAFLERHHVRKLYVKFFDVAVDEKGAVTPVATISFSDSVPRGVEVVPTVFIVENCLRADTTGLAQKLVKRVVQMCETNDIGGVKEVQLDCDWTVRSREACYALYERVRNELREHGLGLSATIRLHQLSMAVPPVDRGVLMVYNTGNPRQLNGRNPILDMRDVEPYLKRLRGYDLPLSAAYPAFQWQLFFSNGKFSQVVYGEVPLKRFVGDTLVTWRPSADEVCRVRDAIGRQRYDVNRELIVYHLDSKQMNNYNPEDYEKIFNR